ncbi:MAG: ACT domain-containing protein, partial [Chloroflexota bacterium]|nr:ACT domain-containing protein [Chloroflexota bacterium]
CKSFTINTAEDLFAAIGYGAISTQQVVANLSRSGEQAAPTSVEPEILPTEPPTDKTTGTVQVMGEGNMLTRLATCCKPLPGDHIVGYITRGRGVTVHRRDCRNVHSVKDKERLVPVDWGDQVICHDAQNLPLLLAQCCGPQASEKIKGYVVDGSVEVHRSDCRRVRQVGPPGTQVDVSWSRASKQQALYPVALRAECIDRPGLLRDISAVVTEEKFNISAASVHTDGGSATIRFTVEVTGVGRLADLMAKIERVNGVVGVQRDVRTDRPQRGS